MAAACRHVPIQVRPTLGRQVESGQGEERGKVSKTDTEVKERLCLRVLQQLQLKIKIFLVNAKLSLLPCTIMLL